MIVGEYMRTESQEFMKIVPIASNHCIIRSNYNNMIDLTTDPSSYDRIYLITKNGTRIEIMDDGTPFVFGKLGGHKDE